MVWKNPTVNELDTPRQGRSPTGGHQRKSPPARSATPASAHPWTDLVEPSETGATTEEVSTWLHLESSPDSAPGLRPTWRTRSCRADPTNSDTGASTDDRHEHSKEVRTNVQLHHARRGRGRRRSRRLHRRLALRQVLLADVASTDVASADDRHETQQEVSTWLHLESSPDSASGLRPTWRTRSCRADPTNSDTGASTDDRHEHSKEVRTNVQLHHARPCGRGSSRCLGSLAVI
jgi:hypothetical protein